MGEQAPGIALVEEAREIIAEKGKRVSREKALERIQIGRDIGSAEVIRLWTYLLQVRT